MQRTRPAPKATTTAPAVESERIIRVYVWELPVRLVHWTIFITTVILAVTGYYLYNPFIVSVTPNAFLMGWMRAIHEVTAFVFTAAFLARVYWFFAGNRFAHWRAFIPLKRSQWRGIRDMLKYYLFLSWRSPEAVGHNSLAAFFYLVVYAIMLVQIVTGFALYQAVVHTQPWQFLFGWVPVWINLQYLLEIHFLIMFVFIAFTVHHVYSSLLVSAEEKNGLMGSMFSGHKFVPQRLVESEEEEESPEPPAAPVTEPSPDGRKKALVPADD
ncbi:MAG TPA: Ni/Fe-hydrogenase, b-type cytochrome subunit [Thermomicrobiaceae bacterium]|nr:Ni/Fe-hydrogenase, b-type cytochrome subunit [Thermomicrobiaceae bacterium]